MPRRHQSFTIEFPGISNVIQSEVEIHNALKPTDAGPDPSMPVANTIAIWDTGATVSMITERIAKPLGIIPFTYRKVKGVHGEEDIPFCKIGIKLPNTVGIRSLNVGIIKEITGPFEMLVGMDIMMHGDLAISHHNGRTYFSFNMPSAGIIDFTGKVKNKPVINEKKVGRNDPCHCGSGKKFKNCHGKH